MKPFFLLSFFLVFLSCDDGDLQIESINFDNVSVQACETVTIDTDILFKIDSDEALVLTLEKGLLLNEETAPDEPRTSNIDESSKLIYRIFNSTVSKNYFCDAIPPVEPEVLEEIPAVNGIVSISTVAVIDESTQITTYEHTISISEMTMVNNKGERLTDLTDINFGTVTTTPAN